MQLQKQKIHNLSQTELVAQCDSDQIRFVEKMPLIEQWVADVQTRHSLADDEMWLLCTEDSKYFKRMPVN